MPYQCEKELLSKVEALKNIFTFKEVTIRLIPDSLRDYHLKIRFIHKTHGDIIANLYFKPSKNKYTIKFTDNDNQKLIQTLSPFLEEMTEKTVDTTLRDAECEYSVYVDGSFMNQRVGYGAVIIRKNEPVFEIFGEVKEKILSSRNVVGELEAVKMSLQWLQQKKIKEVAIFYDYEGISKWVTGEWKANLPLTQQYAQEVRESKVRIHWHKVKSHSGNKWNDRADVLARKAII